MASGMRCCIASSRLASLSTIPLLPPSSYPSLPRAAAKKCSLKVSAQQSQQHGRSHEEFAKVSQRSSSSSSEEWEGIPVLRSRREVFGLGAILATGLGVAIADPQSQAAAASAECAELTTTPSGLAFCDTAVGSGITASKGLLIKAHYSGKLENGKVFDSSYNRGQPLVFRVGVGEVIRGWDQGILGTDDIPPMLAGGKRTLKIPPQLAYGERGAGCRGGSCVIPPNSVLIFDVEFVGKA